jgi:hypothetical protein
MTDDSLFVYILSWAERAVDLEVLLVGRVCRASIKASVFDKGLIRIDFDFDFDSTY